MAISLNGFRFILNNIFTMNGKWRISFSKFALRKLIMYLFIKFAIPMLRPHKLKKESGTILELGRQMQEKLG